MANIKSFPNNLDEYIGAEYVMRWHHGRTSGVFGADNNSAVAAVQNAMAVTVSDGNGWMSNNNADGVVWWNDYEAINGTKLQLSIDAADSVLNRIDRVIVEWKTTSYADLPEIKILKGTAASTAIAPALTNNSSVRQISLARIDIAAGTTAITASMITDERLDATVCGIVTEQIVVDTSMANTQFTALLNHYQNVIDQAAAGQIQDGSVTRAKLASDAMHSPIKQITTANYSLNAADDGCTLVPAYSLNGSSVIVNLSKEVSDALPVGFTFALYWLFGTNLKVIFTGCRLGITGETTLMGSASTTVNVACGEKYGMIAIQKIVSDSTNGAVWAVQGILEVS